MSEEKHSKRFVQSEASLRAVLAAPHILSPQEAMAFLTDQTWMPNHTGARLETTTLYQDENLKAYVDALNPTIREILNVAIISKPPGSALSISEKNAKTWFAERNVQLQFAKREATLPLKIR